MHAEPGEAQDAGDPSTQHDLVRQGGDVQASAPVDFPPEELRGSTLKLCPPVANNSMLHDVVVAGSEPLVTDRQVRMRTGVPRGSSWASTVMSALRSRMQPWLTSVPTSSGWLVPWIPITPSPPSKDVRVLEKPDSP